jgi:type II secretory pathway component HofQ
MIVDDGITGRVTLDVVDVPWTEAFDAVLKQNNLRYERINHTIHVHRN